MAPIHGERSSSEEPQETLQHAVFKGLSPRSMQFEAPCTSGLGSFRHGVMSSIPILMTSTLAAGVIASPGAASLTPSLPGSHDAHTQALDARPSFADRLHTSFLPLAQVVLGATRPDLPATYAVQSGDTVSGIADRFGIPTPAVLALNGLGWNALVHEGQILKLSAEPTKKRQGSPARVINEGYLVQNGETASEIADRVGISTDALLGHNNLTPDTVIYAGQFIALPGVIKPVVERGNAASLAPLSSTPTIVPASVSSPNEDETSSPPDDTQEIFDAADIELVKTPALIKVQVPVKKPVVVIAPPPAPVVEKPAPASSPAAAASEDEEAAEPSSGVGQPVSGSITPLNDERRGNAQIIINVGRELGVPDYGIVIALATAMQESSLRNLDWGDRDSLGLYQQRPSAGWGSAEQIMDEAYATRLFFGGPSNPNKGKTRGLLDFSGWANMALTDAAQRVQISAHPNAYAKWEASAWAWIYELT